MDHASGTVLLVGANDDLARVARSDLALAGFEVASVPDADAVLAAARGRRVAAIVVPQGVSGALWRRWKRDPALRAAPVVKVASARPQLPVPWPFSPFMRADAYASAADLARRGGAAHAVRAAARAAAERPKPRERAGRAIWYAGSVLYLLGGAVAIAEVARTRAAAGFLLGIPLLAVGRILLDVGGCAGLGQRVRLRPATWFWILLLVALAATWVRR